MKARQTHARRDAAFLADWYAENLRPKLARAAREGRVDAFRATAFERRMTDLLAGNTSGAGARTAVLESGIGSERKNSERALAMRTRCLSASRGSPREAS